MAVSSSIDPSRYASLAVTHVEYDPDDPFAKVLSLVTLSPIFLLCAYVTIVLYRRELTFVNATLGQLSCEAFNWILKRLIKQPRPTPHFGRGYGMPSSHSQFLGFFAAFFLAHFAINRPPPTAKRSLVGAMRRIEHDAAMVCIVILSLATFYSRYHLNYHTTAQIVVGASIGIVYGVVYYYLTEYLSRKPLRLPAPLAVSADSSPLAVRANRLISPASARQKASLRRRGPAEKRSEPRGELARARRRSSLSERFLPELHAAPPLRQIVLDHPVAVALRLRDSWTVWRDGGIEGEYGAWRREWERRRQRWRPDASTPVVSDDEGDDADPDADEDGTHYRTMVAALREADKSVPTPTAFCVGCVVAEPKSAQLLATGYSRELPGNTHAEQCALDKLVERYGCADAEGQAEAEQARTVSLDLYTTMEPCSERLSGQAPCVQRILAFNEAKRTFRLPGSKARVRLVIHRVFHGVAEPDDFVRCEGTRLLRDAGVAVHVVRAHDGPTPAWLEQECLRIAKKGHADEPKADPRAVAMWKRA